ncbi:hypothetical protein ScPMuIL_013073 [Solemya velum]
MAVEEGEGWEEGSGASRDLKQKSTCRGNVGEVPAGYLVQHRMLAGDLGDQGPCSNILRPDQEITSPFLPVVGCTVRHGIEGEMDWQSILRRYTFGTVIRSRKRKRKKELQLQPLETESLCTMLYKETAIVPPCTDHTWEELLTMYSHLVY